MCVPMGTYCAPLVAYLFWFCNEIDIMLSLSDKQTDVIEAFNSTSRRTLQLNKANSLDTEAPFLYLNMSINNGKVSSEINHMINEMILILK